MEFDENEEHGDLLSAVDTAINCWLYRQEKITYTCLKVHTFSHVCMPKEIQHGEVV